MSIRIPGGLVLALIGAAPAVAQTVRGALVEELSGRAVPGGFVLLLDTADVERARALTDDFGRYALEAPGPGRYVLRTVVVGMRSWTSEPFDLAAGETRDARLAMPIRAVELPALVVEADRRCRVRPEAGVAAAAVWEEARKALEAVAWTERQGMLRHRFVRVERDRDPNSLAVSRQRTEVGAGFYRGSPFVSRPPEELAAEGFIRPAPQSNEWIYFAPDARVLLSDAFADGHCFAVRDHPDASGLVGLAFEVERGRRGRLADIEGVLWLDAQTAELERLEYRYTTLPLPVPDEQIGGRVEFTRLPSGPWIVSRWWIRMPVAARVVAGSGPIPTFDPPYVLNAIREVGGWVEEVRTLDGRLVYRLGASRLEGEVADTAGRRVANAAVELAGAGRRGRTDEAGRFAFDSLAAGRYLVVVAPDAPGRAGHAAPRWVALAAAETTRVRLAAPGSEDLWRTACAREAPRDTALVFGLVRDAASGAPLEGVTIALRWSGWNVHAGQVREQGFALDVTTDDRGRYVACGVPVRVPLAAAVAREGYAAEDWGFTLRGDAAARRDFALARQR